MLYIINKYFIVPSVVVVGILGVGFADLYGGDIKESKGSVEAEKINRSPFSLPQGVRSEVETFKEGEVAETVIGIFRSGANVRAVINGKWTSEGDSIGEEKVLEIRRDAVVMVGTEGEKRELLLPWTATDLKVIKKVKPPKTKEEK